MQRLILDGALHQLGIREACQREIVLGGRRLKSDHPCEPSSMRSICLLLNQFEILSQVPGVTATMSAIEILEDGAPCPGIVLLPVRLRIERETMRSMTAWLLMSSFHQGPVPPRSQPPDHVPM